MATEFWMTVMLENLNKLKCFCEVMLENCVANEHIAFVK